VIILRHGEKQNDFALCQIGVDRSLALATQYLGNGGKLSLFPQGEKPAAFFAITLHTLELASPAAATWELPVTTFSSVPLPGIDLTPQLNLRTQQAFGALMNDPRYDGKTVVMVWEHPDKDARTGTPYSYFTYDVVRVMDGKIQEHWNSIRRAGPAGTPIESQQQAGAYAIPGVPMKPGYDISSIQYTPQEMKDIEVAIGYYRDVVQSHHHELADKYLAKDEIQHNPVDPTTADGLIAWFNSRNPTPDPLHKEIMPLPDLLLAKSGMVLMMYNRQGKHPDDASKIITTSRFEMVRIENGKVKEHWDTADRKSTTIAPVLDWCLKAGRSDCPKP
jgi:predicted SnoaL-like aldol condensation-catalyzing enzyme